MEQVQKLLREVENEISSEKFIKLYQKVRDKYPAIKSYLTPHDLSECLHNQINPDYILNDKILSNLIQEYKTSPDSGPIGSYLLILFKPGLLKLFSQFRQRAKQFPSIGGVDLWLQIVSLFFEELNHLDLNREDKKIASKITGRIRNQLRGYFKELFKSLQAEADLKVNPEPISSAPIKIDIDEIETILQHLVTINIISETDKYILLATKVYGKSMKELSKDLKDISYANIRQRKTRAQKAILAYYGRKIF